MRYKHSDAEKKVARRAGWWAYHDGAGIDRDPYAIPWHYPSETLSGEWRAGYMAAWERDTEPIRLVGGGALHPGGAYSETYGGEDR